MDIERYSVCVDCYLVHGTGDTSSLDYWYGPKAVERLAEIEAGTAELLKHGGHLAVGHDISEFSATACECCNSDLAGSRCELLVLGGNNGY